MLLKIPIYKLMLSLLYRLQLRVKLIPYLLIKKDLLIGNQRAQWSIIEELYATDGEAGRARTTTLTDKHIRPTSYDKMKVNHAEVFSNTVYISLSMYLKTCERFRMDHNYIVPPINIDNGFFTAEIILFMNNLFDSLNGGGHKSTSLRNALSLESDHFLVLE
ncbi:uncharacterized protein LOC112054598 [Bicyclus anynana]|uniref:Uncharacterized protein LOC112054598 n=1 Tax=Bicyclus anynana TaxID=110368 RepID=A0A6J1NY57_BICAN|nr:uncharacterized protein LOC112054598 [Bicyclus anynana]